MGKYYSYPCEALMSKFHSLREAAQYELEVWISTVTESERQSPSHRLVSETEKLKSQTAPPLIQPDNNPLKYFRL